MVVDLSYLPTGCGYKNGCDQRKITFYKSYLIINVKPPDSFFTYQKGKKKPPNSFLLLTNTMLDCLLIPSMLAKYQND